MAQPYIYGGAPLPVATAAIKTPAAKTPAQVKNAYSWVGPDGTIYDGTKSPNAPAGSKPPVAPGKKGAAPVDPVLQQALAAAQAQIAAAQAPIQAQAQSAQAANEAHGQAIQGFSTALAGILKGVAPQVEQTYGGAADRQAILAKGFSQGAQDAIHGAASQADAILQKQQGPGGQTVQDNSQAVGDSLYGVGGYIPATSMNREGAAYTAAAQLLPANTLRQGAQDYTSNVFAGNAEQADFATKLATIAGTTPQVAQTIYNTLQDLMLKKQSLADSEQKTAFDQGLKKAKFGLDQSKFTLDQQVQQFNAKYKVQTLNLRGQALQLQANKFAQATFNSDRSYQLALTKVGISRKALQLRSIAQEYKLQNGGFSPTKIASYNGLLQQGLDTLPKGATYGDYIRKSVEHGVPLSLAVAKANTHWPITQRGTAQSLSDLFGSAGAATAGAGLVTPGEYNQMTGVGQKATPLDVVTLAKSYLGVPYKWGGTDPAKGLDCSAFLQTAMARVGIKIPRTTYAQVKAGQPVNLNQIQPGDAIFTEPGKNGPNHVGLYIGNGQVQESPHTGDVNKIIPLDSFLSGGFVAARRYLGNG